VSIVHPNSKSLARPFDLAAIGLSGACLLHCLALPVAAVFIPFLSSYTHAHWVHWLFVALAIPLSILALYRGDAGGQRRLGLWAGAGLGIALLTLGALGVPTHDWETPLTVLGGSVLALVHYLNYRGAHRGTKHN
jgi:hypothetical protein